MTGPGIGRSLTTPRTGKFTAGPGIGGSLTTPGTGKFATGPGIGGSLTSSTVGGFPGIAGNLGPDAVAGGSALCWRSKESPQCSRH